MNDSATVKECEFFFQALLSRTLLTLGNRYGGFVVVVVLVCFGLKKGLGTGVGHIIRTVCMQSWKRDARQGAESGDDKGLVHVAEFPVRGKTSNNIPG